ncbi:MAG TPA: hypothetical protein H9903_20125 [Candidatus Aquabacterium excrementipullorum]|nr:hypothetical protein [Candidatus Aquabacterium excrementipullorum]
MYTDEDLSSAVAAGILSRETADHFRNHVEHIRRTPAVDEEHFRLITGFNDVFVVIACVLLLVSVTWIGNTVSPLLGTLALSCTAWALAEFFTRQRRMALPSIVLMFAFVGGAMVTVPALFGEAPDSLLAHRGSAITAAFVAGAAALGAWLHWRRFKVPITVAAGALGVTIGLMATTLVSVKGARPWLPLMWVTAGVLVFLLAMRWDGQDTRRQTRRADVAFWLHLLAAPMLVHPIFNSWIVHQGQPETTQAVIVVALYVGIALVSLAIDRRALMVSALAYVLYTFSSLLKNHGVVSLGFAITALGIGSALLLLSAFWHRSRAGVLRQLPAAWQRRLPPLG